MTDIAKIHYPGLMDQAIINCTLMSSLFVAGPKSVTFAVPIEENTHNVMLFVQMPNVGIFDSILITSTEHKNNTIYFPFVAHGKYVIDQLLPGTEYNFIVQTRSKDMLSTPFTLSSIKTCKYEVPL